nr:hypothetical protein [Streptomyces sp. SID3343]
MTGDELRGDAKPRLLFVTALDLGQQAVQTSDDRGVLDEGRVAGDGARPAGIRSLVDVVRLERDHRVTGRLDQ